MKYEARVFQMKSGQRCVLRSPEPGDAAQRIAFLRQVNGETSFMARGADDAPGDAALVADVIAEQLEDAAVLEIAAFFGGEMIACGGISPVSRSYPRKRHRAQFGICVRKRFWSEGLGGEILTALLREAPGMGFSQVELTVVSDNVRAQRLYRRLGFEEIGRMPDALRYEDGSCRDEIWMVNRLKG